MSNKRKVTVYCAESGCYRAATVRADAFDDDGTDRGSQWLCDRHAVVFTREFGGKVWGDAQCQCGRIDHVIEESGRPRHGDL